ncbi:hypothetical protein ACIBH1_18580 [Nonomuraea sp. NPDC050663]|uniref:hypothetical protein n=1 Tax=Nonomuraea sp. NPDC050663 TaxID=3364370 RepID=UPI00378E399C
MLLKTIQAIAHEPVSLSADRDNTHWLSATADECSTLSTEQVVAALLETARAVRRQIRAADHDGPATFYVWHDEQAGQLRCSTASRAATDLPFGGAYQPTDDLDGIVTGFLSDEMPGLVPWTDLEPVADGDPDPTIPPFPVWTFDVTPRR